jgi:hypothetical protein
MTEHEPELDAELCEEVDDAVAAALGQWWQGVLAFEPEPPEAVHRMRLDELIDPEHECSGAGTARPNSN